MWLNACSSLHFVLFCLSCCAQRWRISRVSPVFGGLAAWRHCPAGSANVRIVRIFHFIDIDRHSQLISQPCPPIQRWLPTHQRGVEFKPPLDIESKIDSIGGYCCCPAEPPTLSPRTSPPLRILCCRLSYHSSRVSLRGTLTSADRLRILIAFLFSQINSVSNSRTPSRPSLSRRSE